MPAHWDRVCARLTLNETLSILRTEGYLADDAVLPTFRPDARWNGILIDLWFNEGNYDPALSTAFDDTLKWPRGLLKKDAVYKPDWTAHREIKALYAANPLGWLSGHVGADRAKVLIRDRYIQSIDMTPQPDYLINASLIKGSPTRQIQHRSNGFVTPRDGWVTGSASADSITVDGITGSEPLVGQLALVSYEERGSLSEPSGGTDRLIDISTDGGGPAKCQIDIAVGGSRDFTEFQVGDYIIVFGCTEPEYNRIHVIESKASATQFVTSIPYITAETDVACVCLYDGTPFTREVQSWDGTTMTFTTDMPYVPRLKTGVVLAGTGIPWEDGDRSLDQIVPMLDAMPEGERNLWINTILLTASSAFPFRGLHDAIWFGEGCLSFSRAQAVMVPFLKNFAQIIKDAGGTIDNLGWNTEHQYYLAFQDASGFPTPGTPGGRTMMSEEAVALASEYKTSFDPAVFAANIQGTAWAAGGNTYDVEDALIDIRDARAIPISNIMRWSLFEYGRATSVAMREVFPDMDSSLYRFSSRDVGFGGGGVADSVYFGTPAPPWPLGSCHTGGGTSGYAPADDLLNLYVNDSDQLEWNTINHGTANELADLTGVTVDIDTKIVTLASGTLPTEVDGTTRYGAQFYSDGSNYPRRRLWDIVAVAGDKASFTIDTKDPETFTVDYTEATRTWTTQTGTFSTWMGRNVWIHYGGDSYMVNTNYLGELIEGGDLASVVTTVRASDGTTAGIGSDQTGISVKISQVPHTVIGADVKIWDADEAYWMGLEHCWSSFHQAAIRLHSTQHTNWYYSIGEQQLVHGPAQVTRRLFNYWVHCFMCTNTIFSTFNRNNVWQSIPDTIFDDFLIEVAEAVPFQNRVPICLEYVREGQQYENAIVRSCLDAGGAHYWYYSTRSTATVDISQVGNDVVITTSAPYSAVETLEDATLFTPANQVSDGQWIRQVDPAEAGGGTTIGYVQTRQILLRDQVIASPEKLGPFQYTRPGIVMFFTNNTPDPVTVFIRGADTEAGPFVADGSENHTIILQGYGRTIERYSNTQKWLSFHLSNVSDVSLQISGYFVPVKEQSFV